MNQQAKILDRMAQRAAEVDIDVQLFTERDGVITPEEQALRDGIHHVYLLAQEAVTRRKLAKRIDDGGSPDKNLLAEWKQLDEIVKALPAQAGGSGGEKKGLAYVRKANGSTRLVRRG